MEQRVSSSIGHAAASMRLTTFTEFKTLSAECALVDFSFCGSAEGHTVVFEFNDCLWCNLGHVLDCVLISEPIGTLDGIVVMVFPAVFLHVSQGSVDTALCG